MLLESEKTYAIIGAAMEVHRVLGHGFLEAVYQEALDIEMRERGIPTRREVALPVYYKGRLLSSSYRADFVCYDSVVVEVKATSGLTTVDYAQLLNYLKATGYEVGVLLNFGTRSLEHKRLVLTKRARHGKSASKPR